MEDFTKYRTFDKSKNKLVLSEEFLLCFEHFDGFGHRMLNMTLLINKEFHFKLEIEDLSRREKYNVDKFKISLEGQFPIILKENLERFLKSNPELIGDKFDFTHPGATDQSQQRYILNILNDSFVILTNPELNYNIVKGGTKGEQRFLVFNKSLNDWLMKIYTEA